LSAQWEHTVLVTHTGVEVLTWSNGTPKAPDCVGPLQYRPNPVAA
jgi:methionyl aminopeptidase